MIQFIELPTFTKNVEKVLGAEGYREFQLYLAIQPDAGDVIPGCQGLRKIRWAAGGHGKRGGARVIYCYRAASGRCYLMAIYPKSVATDLSSEQRKVLLAILSALT